ncbi:hypothetical protein Kpol_499p18 [Vanderwaltozyma polyspora DSM 70294]|uniref:Thioredoxin domain-containing protein n=1 Tax=Vanderwaltozyma polyspora (strain ATCC 22028 / DSM 70294 / BCRC 21397 / CBS 2163 / NBRC 10782 / NRRL Y-8283 / UCD 57-17) TaxID=436907 RepID=A7TP21_VANPO|nr:uncharacterized protein Kpol_499p18 [Vanderwaltozyma polyspora DSM 70294]EDO15990.1 hypothetical protein Kpol_499p18 [Vanderwaltozyma polyspora DSM 70294]
MHFSLIFGLCLFLFNLSSATKFGLLSGDKESNDVVKKDFELPEPLTVNNFKSELQKGLHIVEFYSPYCSHCKGLIPIWKETILDIGNEGKDVGLKFSQVNCIESGDICNEEDIDFFPDIRLYGPSGYIKSFPQFEERSKEKLLAFAREAISDKSNLDIITKSNSKLMSGNTLSKLIKEGGNERGILVSFWPTRNMRNTDDKLLFYNCEDCKAFQRTWSQISELANENDIETVHINCDSYKGTCQELGFHELTDPGASNRQPRIGYILPNSNMKKFWSYTENSSPNPNSILSWALRIKQNSEVPEFSEKLLSKIISFDPTTLLKHSSFQPGLHVVYTYNYDIGRESQISDETLASYLERLSSVPNTNVYKAEPKMLLNLKKSYNYFLNTINYNKTEPTKFLDEEYFNLYSTSVIPTFMIFRDGDSRPYVYHRSTDETEAQMIENLEDLIRDLKYTILPEAKDNDIERIYYTLSESVRYILIQLVDSSNQKDSMGFLKKAIAAIYDYDYVCWKFIVDHFKQVSDQGEQILQRLKENEPLQADATNYITGYLKWINKASVQAVYIDVSKNKNLLKYLGITKLPENYGFGDVLLLDRYKNLLYDHDVFGKKLTASNSFVLKETILSLTLPNYSGFKYTIKPQKFKLKYRVPGSVDLVSILICILVFFLVLIFLIKMMKIYKKNKKYDKKRSIGLLGKSQKKLKD